MKQGGGAAPSLPPSRHRVDPSFAISKSSSFYLKERYRTAKAEWIARQKGSLRECRKLEQRKQEDTFFHAHALTSSLSARCRKITVRHLLLHCAAVMTPSYCEEGERTSIESCEGDNICRFGKAKQTVSVRVKRVHREAGPHPTERMYWSESARVSI